MRVILASGSIVRKQILDSLKFKYEVIKSELDEVSFSSNPLKYCEELSYNKAQDVANKIKDDAIIIAADSIIYKDGKKYEKPKNIEEAKQNLREFSGSKNEAITGITLIDTKSKKCLTFSDTTNVYFKKIEENDIDYYVKNEEYILSRAGYSIEGTLSLFVDKIEGDYYNILGLPLGKLYTKLNELGYYLEDLN